MDLSGTALWTIQDFEFGKMFINWENPKILYFSKSPNQRVSLDTYKLIALSL